MTTVVLVVIAEHLYQQVLHISSSRLSHKLSLLTGVLIDRYVMWLIMSLIMWLIMWLLCSCNTVWSFFNESVAFLGFARCWNTIIYMYNAHTCIINLTVNVCCYLLLLLMSALAANVCHPNKTPTALTALCDFVIGSACI